jgi:hypothetical protein
MADGRTPGNASQPPDLEKPNLFVGMNITAKRE